MMEKPFDYWKHVLWSDESKFNLFGSDGKTMAWRSTTEENDPKCTVSTGNNSEGSLMVWVVSLVMALEICALLRILWIGFAIV